MNNQTKVAVGVGAAAMIAIGLWVGLNPASTAEGFDCGTGFEPASTNAYDLGREVGAAMSGRDGPFGQSMTEQCADELSGRAAVGYVFIGLGVLATSGVWLWRPTGAASRSAP